MATKRTHPQQPKAEALLKISIEEARKRLDERIAIGQGIAQRVSAINSQQSFDGVKHEYGIWDDFNSELLRRIFTADEFQSEYDRSPGAFVIGGDYGLREEIRDLANDVAKKVQRLQSLFERLPLIPIDESVQTPSTVGAKVARSSELVRSNKVFVVHGHDAGAKEAVARFLEKLDLSPVILHEQANEGRTLIEKFEDHSDVAFAVVICTADDIGYPRDEPEKRAPRARQNVILELGFFIGTLTRKNVCVLYGSGVETPSDYAGVLYLPYDASGAWRMLLAVELKAAKLNVDLNKVV